MSDGKPIRAWSNEDGDRWFAEGHHSEEVMKEAAARSESEALWLEVNAADFAGARVFRGWFRAVDPEDEESPLEHVDEGASGAQPWTVLDAELDRDAIDLRPQKRPAWARQP